MFMVASEVTEILTQRSTEEDSFCEDYSDVTLAAKHQIYT